jgi:hypothetical protein
LVEWRVERNWWREVEGVRERRLMVQTGILVVELNNWESVMLR